MRNVTIKRTSKWQEQNPIYRSIIKKLGHRRYQPSEKISYSLRFLLSMVKGVIEIFVPDLFLLKRERDKH